MQADASHRIGVPLHDRHQLANLRGGNGPFLSGWTASQDEQIVSHVLPLWVRGREEQSCGWRSADAIYRSVGPELLGGSWRIRVSRLAAVENENQAATPRLRRTGTLREPRDVPRYGNFMKAVIRSRLRLVRRHGSLAFRFGREQLENRVDRHVKFLFAGGDRHACVRQSKS